MATTTVSYNRSTRKWELLGEIGELIEEFPAGNAGRRAAIVAQLRIEAPDLVAIALNMEARISTLNGRALRGAQLAAAAAILDGGHANRWRVRSQSGRDFYTVHRLRHPHRWNCNCMDWSTGEVGARNGAPWIDYGGTGSPICKHIIAVLLFEKIQLKKPTSAETWPPSCPDCNAPMHVKRHRDDEAKSGLPFWSCNRFPSCTGARDFQPHPDDIKAENGNGRKALYLSLDRARAAGLVSIPTGAKRRARRREMEAARVASHADALPVQHTRGRAKLFKD